MLRDNEIDDLEVPRPRQRLEARLRDGSTCLVTHQGNTFVGFIWIKTENYLEDELRALYRLPANRVAVWDYDLYVAPTFRHTVAFLKIWHDTLEFLREHGIHWTISRISAFAPESLSAHLRLGGAVIGRAYFIRVFFLQLAFASQWPFIHLSLSERSVPSFALHAPQRGR